MALIVLIDKEESLYQGSIKNSSINGLQNDKNDTESYGMIKYHDHSAIAMIINHDVCIKYVPALPSELS